MKAFARFYGRPGICVGYTDALKAEATGRSWARDLLARRPAGVIVAHLGFTPEQHGLLSASGIPMVALDPPGEPLNPVLSVSAANRRGGIAAVQHLLDLGHRRIAVITGPLERVCARDRLEGARRDGRRRHAAGRTTAPHRDVVLNRGRLRPRPGPPAALRSPDRGSVRQRPPGVGVYEAARQAGARVPDDLGVIGFDDISYTRWCGPPMTTVRQPFAEMGSTAAELLLAQATGAAITQTRIELATTLVVRASTAPPTG